MKIKKSIAALIILFIGFFPVKGIADKKTYVTCVFSGELGNQMFEIANVIAHALDHGCEPVFSGFSEAAAGNVNLRYVFHRLNILPQNHGIQFEDYHHPFGHYRHVPIPHQDGINLRLFGHYQNEKYFVRHQDYIKQIFAPSEEIIQYIERKYGKLEDLFSSPTVGVHIRTFIPSARHPDKDGFGGATWEYFIDAMDYFPENYTFLIFSDHPDWVKKNCPFHNRKIKFIEGNPHYIDLYFLSLCHHQVVSPESTFSWWASWLNINPNKVIIVPHFWQQGIPGEEAFPPEWVKIYAKNKLGY